MSHTPGPYKVVEQSKGSFGIYAGQTEIARTPVANTEPAVAELRANADLLAAAPEMLAALKDVEQFFHRLADLHPTVQDTIFGRHKAADGIRTLQVATRVMAAIGKATPMKKRAAVAR